MPDKTEDLCVGGEHPRLPRVQWGENVAEKQTQDFWDEKKIGSGFLVLRQSGGKTSGF